MIYINNLKYAQHITTAQKFYVGRPSKLHPFSPLGNPFAAKNSKLQGVIKVASDAEAVQLYRKWLWLQIKNKNNSVLGELIKIKAAAEKGDVTLVCWCVDENGVGVCHARIIKSAVEWLAGQDK